MKVVIQITTDGKVLIMNKPKGVTLEVIDSRPDQYTQKYHHMTWIVRNTQVN